MIEWEDYDPDDFERGLYGHEMVNWQPSDPPVRSGPPAPFPAVPGDPVLADEWWSQLPEWRETIPADGNTARGVIITDHPGPPRTTTYETRP